MTWFWLNIPLATVFLLAWALIPLWMVIRHPDVGPPASGPAQARCGPAPAAQPEPVHSDGTGRQLERACCSRQ